MFTIPRPLRAAPNGCLLVLGTLFIAGALRADEPSLAPDPFPLITLSVTEEYHDKTTAQHVNMTTDLTSRGYRLISLNLSGNPLDPRYAAVWRTEAGPPTVPFWSLSYSQLLSLANFYLSSGYHPALLTATGSTRETAVYAGVFVHDGPDFGFAYYLSPEQLKSECDQYRKNGYVLRSLSAYGTTSNPLFTAVWTKGDPDRRIGWGISLEDSLADFNNKYNAYMHLWARPHLITRTVGGRYAAIWYDDQLSGGWFAYPWLTKQQLEQKIIEHAPQFKPIRVQAGGVGSATRYAAIFARNENILQKNWTALGAGVAQPAIDDMFRDFMFESNVRAAQVAIVKDARLVYTRAYTAAEPNWQITQTSSVFRIGSVSKPLTAIATYQFRERSPNPLSLSDLVYPVLGLNMNYSGANTIRIRHLLNHTSGLKWNPRSDYDVAAGLSIPYPVSKDDVIRYTADTRGLDFTPGMGFGYSNVGYQMLGSVLAAKSGGLTYSQLMHANLFAPLAITRPRVGRSARYYQPAGEVRYYDPAVTVGESHIDNSGSYVPAVYGGGGQTIENMDSGGGWTMAAADLAKVMAAFHLGVHNPILSEAGTLEMFSPDNTSKFTRGGWSKWNSYFTKGGAAGGGRAALYYNPDGLTVIVFCASGASIGKGLVTQAEGIDWPNQDLFPSTGIPSFFGFKVGMEKIVTNRTIFLDSNSLEPIEVEVDSSGVLSERDSPEEEVFQWVLGEEGSGATIADPRAPDTVFTLPGPGRYSFDLIVVRAAGDASGDSSGNAGEDDRAAREDAPIATLILDVVDLRDGKAIPVTGEETPEAGGTAASDCRRGDVDGSGDVSMTDAILLTEFVLEGSVDLLCPDAGDMNDDGKLSIEDVLALLSLVAEDGEPTAAPEPTSEAG